MNSSIPYLNVEEKLVTDLLETTSKPAIIVEGKTDIYVYEKLFTLSTLDFSCIDIVVGECKNDILRYVEKGLSFKYIAIIDADYSYMNGDVFQHNNVVNTHYYNVENYLCTNEVIKRMVSNFSTISIQDITSEQIIDDAIEAIKPFILACMGKQKFKWNITLEDYNIERWYVHEQKRIPYQDMEEYLLNNVDKDDVFAKNFSWNTLEDVLETHLHSMTMDHLINGKHKLNAIYFQFKYAFPLQMNNRRKETFITDLTTQVVHSGEAMELIKIIEDKANELELVV